MYVAITRARKRLYLSRAQTRMLHGQTRYHVPSRFLNELPERTLKWISPRGGAFSGAPARASVAPVPDWVAARRVSAGDGAATGEAGPAQAIATGMTVFHNKFGEGRVRAVEGSGASARAQVAFRRHGVKWLALAVAKLTVVE